MRRPNIEQQAVAVLSLKDNDELKELFGDFDTNLKLLKQRLKVRVYARGLDIVVSGLQHDVTNAEEVIRSLINILRNKGQLEREYVEAMVANEQADEMHEQSYTLTVQPRTAGQREYLDAIDHHDIVLCTGPAGTGKTYLSVAMAVTYLRRKQVERIILCRPAVEAGENLGYLPGSVEQKVSPYLIPLQDALNELLKVDKVRKLQSAGVIEIAPLAFMRGRSLNHAFIILDEAQNTTYQQMKMFLTRMGRGSKMVVAGDLTQVDLNGKRSGFSTAIHILENIPNEVGVVHLTDSDVVRHKTVQAIINAYDVHERQEHEEKNRTDYLPLDPIL